ncbi:hypothetical protein [Maritimibacter sp. DP1N21-5]|uniref:COG3904 family protein n=1 Tax=Maritimibacter sp. DP1N21-5 TaxID=2836867 RepID=UPI001C445BCB|nr:hypothetical protein [Maritimibacter sp. DP1N21-5]MBV7410393.1 hypothetical protein [Maritimibacter sp. DP1N21-5]
MSQYDDLPEAPPSAIRKAMTAVIAAQVLIAGLLVVSDISAGRTGADPLTLPTPGGPSTRPYNPERRPAMPGETETGPMAERLEVSGEGPTLTLTGQIAPGDAQRIGDALATRANAGQRVERINLDSTGGSVFDAIEIGETIRASGIATNVGDNAVCLSACPYMLAGGTTRSAASTARVGVHQHYFGENTILPAFMAVEDVQRGQAEVMAYLTRMGIGLGVMEHAMRTPPEQIYLLTPEELVDYAFVTEADAPEEPAAQ